MRRYILLLIIAAIIPVIGISQEYNVTITPDNQWTDTKQTWFVTAPAVINFQGTIFVFNMKTAPPTPVPYIYTFNQNHDNGALAPYNIGPSQKNIISQYPKSFFAAYHFAFQFDNRLWYYIYSFCGNDDYNWFGQMPVKQSDDWFSFSDKVPDKAFYPQSAFQVDSNLYILGYHSPITNLNAPDNWQIQEYGFNESAGKFFYRKTQTVYNIRGSALGGLIERVDSLGQKYLVTNTYVPKDDIILGKLMPRKTANGMVFDYVQLSIAYNLTETSTIVQGTIQGRKTSESLPQYRDRLTVMGFDNNKSSDGTHPIVYAEFYAENDNFHFLRCGQVTVPKVYAPNPYAIKGVFELIPQDYTDDMDGIDGYQQKNWFLYPDANNHFLGIQFVSDQWRIDSSAIVTSYDIGDTTITGVKSLWTLAGIVEGAPPVSVNWDIWNEKHRLNTPASTLKLEQSATNSSEVSNTYEDMWGYGGNFKISKAIMKVTASIAGAFQHSNSYQSSVKNSTTVKQTFSQTFDLLENTQSNGYFIWTIPQIRRYSYSLFPWWDNNTLNNPVPNSTQYLFRVIGFSIYNESKSLSGHPYYITDPNDLNSWMAQNRPDVVMGSLSWDLRQCMSLNWDDHSCGSTSELDVSTESSTGYQNSSSFEATVGAGIKVPKVFQISGSANYEVGYSSGTTESSELERNITASLDNLFDKDDGTNIGSLDIGVFLFRPETNNNWWFYEGLNGAKPWYLAYVANSYYDKIRLVAPDNASALDKPEISFSWRPENGEISSYTLFIATAPNIASDNIVYKENVGSLTELKTTGFNPVPGGTYFWAVRGSNIQGDVIWSDCRSFTLKKEAQPVSTIQAKVYPNPGRFDDMRFFIKSASPGMVSVTLQNFNGGFITGKEVMSDGTSVVSVDFQGVTLAPGIYFATFTTGNDIYVKKVIVK